jgi:hypothetical protein
MAENPLEIGVGETLTIREQLGISVKRATEKKPFVERWSADDLHKASGTWRKRERLIDRDDDWYSEVITDAGGNEVHRCEEPLSSHRGHGSAKRA